jgi:hypothetical protein
MVKDTKNISSIACMLGNYKGPTPPRLWLYASTESKGENNVNGFSYSTVTSNRGLPQENFPLGT